MTYRNATLIFRRAGLAAELPGSLRLSSRTARTTGATAARAAGVSLEDIAESVTLHATLSEAKRYVRNYRPEHLDLDV